jgi:zinc-ribbon domain
MNKINWTVVVIIAIALLLVASLFGGRGYGGWGMMGPGMMGGWGFSPFGWVGMIFMWLIPLGLIVLVALGVVWLVRAVGSGKQSALPGQACPSCGRTVQTDWRNCPHCGTQLLK